MHIPVRVDVESEGRKISDVFVMDSRSSDEFDEVFCELFCSDLLLPHEPFKSEILRAIGERKREHREIEGELLEVERKHRGAEIAIRLDLFIDRTRVTDGFLWNLSGEKAVDVFSECYVRENGLPASFVSGVSCSIREQVYNAKKGALIGGGEYLSRLAVELKEENPLPRTPLIRFMSEEEKEKFLMNVSREERRKKRQSKTGKLSWREMYRPQPVCRLEGKVVGTLGEF
ncbi:MAG: uncharacterized protein A8A55_0267 [Amphiamblys sp. WSBS2006]|nr:MAG: uncharacterized protein A8A55_0267 [Amphiamblys sp. WSBS2006]